MKEGKGGWGCKVSGAGVAWELAGGGFTCAGMTHGFGGWVQVWTWMCGWCQ